LSDIDRTLRLVVRSAAHHIPVYRRLLERYGVSATDVHSVADLPLLPIVEKEALFRDAPLKDQLHDRTDASQCVRVGTSGFTGLPIDIYMSKAEALFRRAQLVAAWCRFTRLPLPLRVADVGSWGEKEPEYELVRRGPASILRISIALPIDRQIDLLKRHDPQVVSGYPTALSLLVEGLRESSVPRSVRLVATRGEVLHAPVRATVEEVFGCRVADFYNCEEIGNIASECPEDSRVLHINTDACVLEVVDDEGRSLPLGQEGRILLTNLYNCTMPFIRYDIRDRGAFLPSMSSERCACGSWRPKMEVLGGRDDDFVILPDGRRMSPRLMTTAVEHVFTPLSQRGGGDCVFRRFQIVQDAIDHLTVRIIPEAGQLMEFDGVIAGALRRIHPALCCTVVLVDDLPHEPSGKFKKVIRSFEASDTSTSHPAGEAHSGNRRST